MRQVISLGRLSESSMVNAGEQYDRKLRPVYDALEARNYKVRC